MNDSLLYDASLKMSLATQADSLDNFEDIQPEIDSVIQLRNDSLGRDANLDPDPIAEGLRQAYMGHLFSGTSDPNDIRFTSQPLYTSDSYEYERALSSSTEAFVEGFMMFAIIMFVVFAVGMVLAWLYTQESKNNSLEKEERFKQVSKEEMDKILGSKED